MANHKFAGDWQVIVIDNGLSDQAVSDFNRALASHGLALKEWRAGQMSDSVLILHKKGKAPKAKELNEHFGW